MAAVSTRVRLWATKLRQRRLPLLPKLVLGGTALFLLVLVITQPPRIVLPTWHGYPNSHFRFVSTAGEVCRRWLLLQMSCQYQIAHKLHSG